MSLKMQTGVLCNHSPNAHCISKFLTMHVLKKMVTVVL